MGDVRPASRNEAWMSVFASESAFRSWYETTLPRVYAYLYSRSGGDPALAEELTQQTFVTIVAGHRAFRGDSDPMTWVIAIARRKLVDHFRHEKRAQARHDRLIAQSSSGDSESTAWARPDRFDEAQRALAALPGEQRAAFILRYVDGLAVREVADAIGRSGDATESLLRRARAAFDAARAGNRP